MTQTLAGVSPSLADFRPVTDPFSGTRQSSLQLPEVARLQIGLIRIAEGAVEVVRSGARARRCQLDLVALPRSCMGLDRLHQGGSDALTPVG